jgi:hypothetical protein
MESVWNRFQNIVKTLHTDGPGDVAGCRACCSSPARPGSLAAHGMWSMADSGGPITPLSGHEDATGRRGSTRFVADDLETAATVAPRPRAAGRVVTGDAAGRAVI